MKTLQSFCVLVLLMAAWPIQAQTGDQPPASNQPGILPNEQVLVKPYVWVQDFITGENGILESHLGDLRKIQYWMAEHPTDVLVLIGMVSDLKIRSACYYNFDTGYYSLRHNQPGCTATQGDRVCQEALAMSRAIAVRNWLLNPNNWIKDSQGNPVRVEDFRIRILDFRALGLRAGGNYPNQSVAAWMITFDQANVPGLLTIVQPCPPPALPLPAPPRRAKTTIHPYIVDP